jgi:hypothetical protein
MDKRPAIVFDDLNKVVELLAEGNSVALAILRELVEQPDVLNTLVDLTDMNIRGAQIVSAMAFAKGSMQDFTTLVATRDQSLVDAVNLDQPHMPRARRHGEQKRISQVDFAVQSALEAQQMDGVVERMDEGADVIHNFFLGLIKSMQAAGKFTINMSVNLGLESGHTAVFAIALAELRDKDGNPYQAQPQDEAKRIEALQSEIAAERETPFPPEVQQAINEGRW